MPKIVRFHALGGPENLKLEECASRSPGAGEVLLEVHANAVTGDCMRFMAKRTAETLSRFGTPPLPSRLGHEAAGVVKEVGEGVDRNLIGTKVATLCNFDQSLFGVMGEEAVVPEKAIFPWPSVLSAAEATSLWVPFLTAYGPLVNVAKVAKADWVAIIAGTSSVGLAAIQIAKDAGAQTIAVTRSSARKADLIAAGADHVIATDEEDYVARVREITAGNGARVTFDPVGGAGIERLAEASAHGGIILEYGVMDGFSAPFPVFHAISKGLTLRGYAVGELLNDAVALAAAREAICERIADGRYSLKVAHVWPLEAVAEAFSSLTTERQIGRVVLSCR